MIRRPARSTRTATLCPLTSLFRSFRHRNTNGNPLLPSPLPVAALRARIERCWRPYHHARLEALDALHARHGAVWHIDAHSMKSVGTAITPDGPGAERPDMVIGDLDGDRKSTRLNSSH